jgi:hypothetical protein
MALKSHHFSLTSAPTVRALVELVLQTTTELACVFWEAIDEYGRIGCRFNTLVPCPRIVSALVQALLNTMGK